MSSADAPHLHELPQVKTPNLLPIQAAGAALFVLGALTYLLPFAVQRTMKKSLEDVLPPKIRPANVKAFNLGHRLAKKDFGEEPELWKGKPENEDSGEMDHL